jgi:hypothetical protein
VYTAKNLVPGTRRLAVGIAIAKFKTYKSPGSGQFPEELLQAGCEILLSALHTINSIWNKKNCLISGRSPLLYDI